MAEHGGYRAPAHPAAVSGPGALSARTDGGPSDPKQAMRKLPDAKYGEQRDYQAAEQAGPMAGSQPPPQVVPLDAPSQRPDEPTTAGAATGPGPGPQNPSLAQADMSALLPLLPGLQALASMPDSTPSMRAMVRAMEAAAAT